MQQFASVQQVSLTMVLNILKVKAASTC